MTAAPAYPRAERLDLVETLHGHAVADPYRWLEDPDDPRTRTWSAEETPALLRKPFMASSGAPPRGPRSTSRPAMPAAGSPATCSASRRGVR